MLNWTLPFANGKEEIHVSYIIFKFTLSLRSKISTFQEGFETVSNYAIKKGRIEGKLYNVKGMLNIP